MTNFREADFFGNLRSKMRTRDCYTSATSTSGSSPSVTEKRSLGMFSFSKRSTSLWSSPGTLTSPARPYESMLSIIRHPAPQSPQRHL
jgi:hypothetical protein